MPEDNLSRILKEFDELKGQFVIVSLWDIERLIAIGDDDEDYYYVTWDGRKSTWHTCVGRIIPLKDHIRDEDYNEIVRVAKINHQDSPDFMMHKDEAKRRAVLLINKEVKDDIEKLDENHKYLTEVCWDFN